MPKSSSATPASKPSKPHPAYPLYAHASGRWAKKVLGRTRFLGPWSDPQAALDRWLYVKEYWLNGREPPASSDAPTVADLVNHFLTAKKQSLDSGELAERSFDRYYMASGLLVSAFGKNRAADDLRPDDFQALRGIMAKRWGPVALGNEIQIIRSIFKHGFESRLLPAPILFGPGFKKPSAKTLRLVRAASGPKVFPAAEIHAALAKADTNMQAMVLLGLNCALGNTDLALLPIKAFDLDGGWLTYPRSKTGIPRRIKLWPETVVAIRKCAAERKEPKDPEDSCLLFISPHRRLNYIGKHKGYRITAVMARLMTAAEIEGPRTFYDLRRTFQTIAEGARDLTAVQAVMGHAPPATDMSAIYRQRVDDSRLEAVSAFVRAWLFSPKKVKSRRKAK